MRFLTDGWVLRVFGGFYVVSALWGCGVVLMIIILMARSVMYTCYMY